MGMPAKGRARGKYFIRGMDRDHGLLDRWESSRGSRGDGRAGGQGVKSRRPDFACAHRVTLDLDDRTPGHSNSRRFDFWGSWPVIAELLAFVWLWRAVGGPVAIIIGRLDTTCPRPMRNIRGALERMSSSGIANRLCSLLASLSFDELDIAIVPAAFLAVASRHFI
jgi:hypothetical protein